MDELCTRSGVAFSMSSFSVLVEVDVDDVISDRSGNDRPFISVSMSSPSIK